MKMKGSDDQEPYEIVVNAGAAVITKQNTFYQLINRADQDCRVLYICSPAFLFAADKKGRVFYNDAIVFEESWNDSAAVNYVPDPLSNLSDFHKRRAELFS